MGSGPRATTNRQRMRNFGEQRKELRNKEAILLSIFITLFIASTVLCKLYADPIRYAIGYRGILGIAAYQILIIIGEIVIPAGSLPLLPIAVLLWGKYWSAVLTVTGWMICSIIAFGMARRYGRILVSRFIDTEEMNRIGRTIPHHHLFFTTALFRLVFPVGLVSYALGIFTHINWFRYLAATALGSAPLAFLSALILTLPLSYRILAEAVGIIVAIGVYLWIRKKLFMQLRK
jgi:uncharacterized membrane protein YdjX (TVP38/TMEM64 family)